MSDIICARCGTSCSKACYDVHGRSAFACHNTYCSLHTGDVFLWHNTICPLKMLEHVNLGAGQKLKVYQYDFDDQANIDGDADYQFKPPDAPQAATTGPSASNDEQADESCMSYEEDYKDGDYEVDYSDMNYNFPYGRPRNRSMEYLSASSSPSRSTCRRRTRFNVPRALRDDNTSRNRSPRRPNQDRSASVDSANSDPITYSDQEDMPRGRRRRRQSPHVRFAGRDRRHSSVEKRLRSRLNMLHMDREPRPHNPRSAMKPPSPSKPRQKARPRSRGESGSEERHDQPRYKRQRRCSPSRAKNPDFGGCYDEEFASMPPPYTQHSTSRSRTKHGDVDENKFDHGGQGGVGGSTNDRSSSIHRLSASFLKLRYTGDSSPLPGLGSWLSSV
ncbi:hypothetical protein B0H63DRAFT_287666 [Podospora didyma]|uniref:Uncharacterized protein n=1 Tax=Podospora didyma TaxID=330526 RepID=A0AAE0N793_9PEZI|nr:hypothetical protein B0H63DRAFT_287666 [Podospora didyma]